MVCAWTIFISARVKRPFMALGATLGTLALGLIVLPALFSSLAMGDRFSTEMFVYLNPFSAMAFLTMVENARPDTTSGVMDHFIPLSLYGIPHVLIYLGLSVGLLVYAEKTLHFPENEVKFIPQGHHDA